MQRARPHAPICDTARGGRRAALFLSAALLLTPVPAAAQASPETADGATSPEAIQSREQELEAAREAQARAAQSQEKLKAEIAAIGQDRGALNQQLIDQAAQVRELERRMADAEARLNSLDAREQEIKSSLKSRRSEIVEVLAALQRAGRRAPPALLVRPEDALGSLRTAILLGAVVPELRTRAERLADELGELVVLRKTISAERDGLARDRDTMRDGQARLAALIAERQRQQTAKEEDMAAQGARAIALARQVDDLKDLIARMEQEVKAAEKAAAEARGRPAVAFASTRGLLTLPVNGKKLHDFGSPDGAGGTEKGISLVTQPGAQVTTPCDGTVVYAGPFRSYGQLLILNAGGGYHVLIAGMERISVNIGQPVLAGEPIATMGSTSASILAQNVSQPVLYIELRKDGAPIDSGPWWAAKEGEKVHG